MHTSPQLHHTKSFKMEDKCKPKAVKGDKVGQFFHYSLTPYFLFLFFLVYSGVGLPGVLFQGNKTKVDRCQLAVRCHSFGSLSLSRNFSQA
jgi:hypothetical protein